MFGNPQYNSLKVILLVALLVLAGYFAFTYQHKSNTNQGLVLNQVEQAPNMQAVSSDTGTPQAPGSQQPPQPQSTFCKECYVFEIGNHRVQRFIAGTYYSQWGTQGTNPGQFISPASMAFNSSGNIFTTDVMNNNIQVFSSSGTYLYQWGTPGSGNGQFAHPFGIAVSSSGNVYVSDMLNNRIQVFTSNGIFLMTFGWGVLNGANQFQICTTTTCHTGIAGAGNGQLYHPSDVEVDSSGNVYVSDNANNRVQKFSSSGTYLTQWGSLGYGPGQFDGTENMPIAADNSGNVYVGNHNRIQKFTSSGAYILEWGSPGQGNGQFGIPTGISVGASDGNIYVTSKGGPARFQEFTPSGVYLNQSGSTGNGNGQFIVPMDIVVK